MDPLALTRLSTQKFNKRKEAVHAPGYPPLILADEVSRQWLPEHHLSIVHTLLSLKAWARSHVQISMHSSRDNALHLTLSHGSSPVRPGGRRPPGQVCRPLLPGPLRTPFLVLNITARIPFRHLLVVWPWRRYLISLSHNFTFS